jgi:hypothetical protein
MLYKYGDELAASLCSFAICILPVFLNISSTSCPSSASQMMRLRLISEAESKSVEIPACSNCFFSHVISLVSSLRLDKT